MEPVIKVTGLGKQYRLGGQKKTGRTLVETLTDSVKAPFVRRRPDETNSFWALKDVNFEIHAGDVVGIIGRNGAGKSTLLKILSRITDPTEGEIDITGRIGSLLEVGTGFHPELTGRENVYLNGAILGMKKAEIAKKFDEIVAFAGTEKFLDTPVKYYSSGMYTRLAFAVAAHLDPEILIVDEVLAVGDAEFQKKCLGKMKDVAGQGRTVLFVSHNLVAIENLCTRGVYLIDGKVHAVGPIHEVTRQYRAMADVSQNCELALRTDRLGDQRLKVASLELLDQAGEPIGLITPGTPFRFRLTGVASKPVPQAEFSVDIESSDGTRLTTLYSGFQGTAFEISGGTFEFDCVVGGLELRPDTYTLNVWAGAPGVDYDLVTRAASFEIGVTDFYGKGKLPGKEHGPLMSRYQWVTPDAATS